MSTVTSRTRRHTIAAFLLLSVFFFSNAYAQISFSKADYESIVGTSRTSDQYDALSGQDVTIQALADKTGPSQTWDFTGLKYGAPVTGTSNFVALPADLPGSDDPRVADATYAVQILLTGKASGVDQSAAYFAITDTEHLNFGIYSVSGGVVSDLLYDSPALEHKVPLVYDDTWNGSGTYHTSAGGFTSDVTTTISGQSNGWGTLILPGHDPMQALRTEVDKTISTTVMGFPASTFSFTLITFQTKEGDTAEITITPPQGANPGSISAHYQVSSSGGGTQAPTDAPDGLTPAAGSTVSTDPDLEWGAVSGALTYDLQVATDNSFTKAGSVSAVIVDETELAETAYHVDPPLDNSTTYYWRARGVNEGGAGPWSDAISFTTEDAAVTAPASAPTNLMPVDLAVDVATNPQFSWDAVVDAATYHLQVATDASFTKAGLVSSIVIDEPALAGTSYNASGLDNSATYYWRVLGSNAGGDGPWSATQSFTTEAEAVMAPTSAPGGLSPLDMAMDVSVTATLSWDAVTDADSYDLQVATDDSFTKAGGLATVVIDETGLLSTSYQVLALNGFTTYFWRVRGANSGGAGPWSPTQSFETGENVAVEQLDGSLPTDYVLYNNYPNPFNPQTTIRFDIPTSVNVRLSVFDALGREVDVLVSERLNAGRYEFTWDAGTRPSGAYLYRLQAGAYSRTGTMVLLK